MMKTRFTSISLHATSLMRHTKVASPSAHKGRLVLTLLLMLTTTMSRANIEVLIDDIKYSLNSSDYTAGVIQKGGEEFYSGDITIPLTVMYDNVDYDVNSIIGSAFAGCTNLTSVTIPVSVKTIGNNAFADCTNLATVTIPVNVTSIGKDAFAGCTNLATVTVYALSCTLGTDAFKDCNKLSHIYVFADKVTYYQGATNWSNYDNKISEIPNSGNCGATGHESDVKYVLTGTSTNYSLTVMKVGETGAMADYDSPSNAPWYSNLANITSVTIEDGVTHIGNYALSNFGNTNFTSLTIPISVKTIGTNAVYNCQNLETVDVGNGVETIGVNAFKSCSKLENLTIGGSVKTIAQNAFDGCSALTSVTIPADVKEIKYRAFYGCSNLVSVTCFATNVPSLGEEVFDGNKDNRKIYVFKDFESAYENATNWISYADKIEALTPVESGYCGDPEVNSGQNVTWELVGTSGNYAIHISGTGDMANYSSPSVSPWDSYWASLKSVVIEDGVTSIGERAFRYLTKVKTISLGSGVTRIGKSAFGTCKGLTSVIIPNNVKNIDDGAFQTCIDLETISFGSGVTEIGPAAFMGCTSLSSINLPDNLTRIGKQAFQGCNNASLTSINIPASVTSIASQAFLYCSNLATVTLNSNPFIGNGAFSYMASGAEVTMNLTATVGAAGEYWMTFYNQYQNFQVPATGTQIFKTELNEDKLTIRELTTDKIVTKNKPVILKSTTNHITLTLTSTNSSNDFDTDNSLSGVYQYKGKKVTDDPSTTYALNSGAQGVGFYKVPTGNTIGVGNAYVTSTSTSDFLPLVVVTSGNCGDTSNNGGADVTWSYDTTTKTLTISGTGPMMYYDSALGSDSKYHSTAPWSHLDSEIQKVIVGDGVTYIGSYAFAYCTALTSVSLPATVSALGDYVCYSSNVIRIDIPSATAATLGAGGFNYCHADLQIAVPSTLLGTYQTATNWSAYEDNLVGVLSETTGFGTTFATGNYEYTRTFKCGVASTVCLPFSLDAAQAASVGKFYSFAGIDKSGEKWEVIMKESEPNNLVSTDLTANTPYLFKPYIFEGKTQGDDVEFTFSGTVSTAGDAGYSGWIESGTSNEWAFQGVYYNYVWSSDPDNIYGFAAQSYDGGSYNVSPGDFVKAGAGASIAPFRAFLQCNTVTNAPRRGAAENLPSRMTVRLVNADGETTSLTPNSPGLSQGEGSEYWYDLSGRKLDKQPTQKGVYINNGKKVVIK